MLSTCKPNIIDSTRPKKTPSQTLARVRNNQRRHRERRRQYIASLEQKAKETELLLNQARTDIAKLETELAKFQSHNNGTGMDSDSQQHLNEVALTENQQQKQSRSGAQQPLTSTESDISYAFQGPIAPSKQSTSQPIVSDLCSKNSLAVQSPLSIQYPHTQLYLPLGSLFAYYQHEVPSQCCPVHGDVSDTVNDLLTKPTPATSADQSDGQLMTPYFDKDYPYPGEDSTTSCVQAYIVIAQQNFRGVSMETIEGSLYRGFRRAVTSGGECRVINRVLFELLDFISGT